EPRGRRVSLYVCGITPYESAHLGHAFTYHVFDVLTRRLRQTGLDVRSVRNVTDVDDDILRVAVERGIDFRVLTAEQVRRFDDDMTAINLLPVDASPHATAHVDAMVPWIAQLVDSGHAYVRDGWVFFRVASDPGYGRVSHLGRAEMIALSRERGADPDDPRKEDKLDFVLWQASAPGEPRWPSPWGAGRPGWHIECSVLSTGELGTPIDIHGGGDDLVFPHHECEAAQAEGAGRTPYVRHWVHCAMVRYQGEKMSKSLGNLVFVRDLLHEVPAATIRLLLASHHHHTAWEYEPAMLQEADALRRRLERAVGSGTVIDADETVEVRRRFDARLDDDLDTPGALQVAEELAAQLERGGAGGRAGNGAWVLSELIGALGVAFEHVEARDSS
ncbi:MAG: cysteine--tRNA ligase, partial [Candidatus Dormibacteraeota bacterium]|nr:cysteine--tRNA ligase [Candidatus Dormibacteraeota bacterium]